MKTLKNLVHIDPLNIEDLMTIKGAAEPSGLYCDTLSCTTGACKSYSCLLNTCRSQACATLMDSGVIFLKSAN